MIFDRAEVEATLSGFALGPELGRGGGGIVFSARQVDLDRDVAVKVLGGDGVAREAFRAEARILGRLDHPHVVPVYHFIEGATLSVIVMELMRGGSLASRFGRTDRRTLCATALAVAEGLHFVHASGVLHRDVKPANILFTADGVPKVGDFGIARMFEGSGVTPSQVVGTPMYMAPEQFDDRRLTTATDLYALGVVVYQMLAGRPPFGPARNPARLMRHHLELPPPPMDGVPPALAAPVLRALSKDPADRQPSVRAFAVELAAGAAELFGPGWLARTGMHLCLADEVEAAAGARPEPDPTPVEPAEPRWVPDLAEDLTIDAGAASASSHRKPRTGRGRRFWLAAALSAVLAATIAWTGTTLRDKGTATPSASTAPQASESAETPSPIPSTATPPPTPDPDPSASTPLPPPSPSSAEPEPTLSPVFAPVVIYNYSQIQGQAQAAVERVEAAGFRVDRIGSFRGTYYIPVSTVFYDSEHEAAARTMLERVPGVERMVPRSETNIVGTGTLILVVTKNFPTDLTEG